MTITNPAPAGKEPVLVSQELWRRATRMSAPAAYSSSTVGPLMPWGSARATPAWMPSSRGSVVTA